MASTEKNTNNTATTNQAAAGAHASAVKPLETLPSMLHAVMIQTANVFSPEKHNPRALMHTNAIVKHGVAGANDRFQYALDLLEIDIMKAKAVLARDLHKRRHAVELARQQEEAAVAAAKALADKEEQARLAKIREESERVEMERKRKEEEEKERIRKAAEEEEARKKKEEEEKKERERKEQEEREAQEKKEREAAEEAERKRKEAEAAAVEAAAAAEAAAAEAAIAEAAAANQASSANATAVAATSNDPIILDTPPPAPEDNPPQAQPMTTQLSAGMDLFGDGILDSGKADGGAPVDIDMNMGENIGMDLLFGADLDDPSSMDVSGVPQDQGDNGTGPDLDFKLEDVDMGMDMPQDLTDAPVEEIGSAPVAPTGKVEEAPAAGSASAVGNAQDGAEEQQNMNENNFEDLLAGFEDGSMFNEDFDNIYNYFD